MLPQDNFQKLIQYQSTGEMFFQDEETFSESVKVMQVVAIGLLWYQVWLC